MINRPRTAFVSIAAVAVSMIVLGTDARAKSGPAASPQKYVRYLEKLAKGEMKNGTSLVQRASSLESTLKRLENIPNPGPRLAAKIAADFKQESKVVASLQNNANALQATIKALMAVPLADLPPQQQAQVSSVVKSGQILVAAEKGVATPVR